MPRSRSSPNAGRTSFNMTAAIPCPMPQPSMPSAASFPPVFSTDICSVVFGVLHFPLHTPAHSAQGRAGWPDQDSGPPGWRLLHSLEAVMWPLSQRP